MIKYQRVSSVNLPKPTGLPRITRTPEGEAMGGIPGWAYLMHPDYADASLQRVRDIANPDAFATMRAGTLSTTDVLGNPFLNVLGTAPGYPISLHTDLEINPEEFSVFAVIDSLESRTSTQSHSLIGENATSEESEVTLNLSITSDGGSLVVYERSLSTNSPVRVTYEGDYNRRSSPSLVMLTFSVSHGIRLFDGGALVASNPDDKLPLTQSPLIGVTHFRNAALLSGPIGVLNLDLSAPRNAGHRRAIEKFLMAKYGIPEGPQ